jgi:hypothetical protein
MGKTATGRQRRGPGAAATLLPGLALVVVLALVAGLAPPAGAALPVRGEEHELATTDRVIGITPEGEVVLVADPPPSDVRLWNPLTGAITEVLDDVGQVAQARGDWIVGSSPGLAGPGWAHDRRTGVQHVVDPFEGGEVEVRAVSSAGIVVGSARTPPAHADPGTVHAFAEDVVAGTVWDLGRFESDGGTGALATAISDTGYVAGSVHLAPFWAAFLLRLDAGTPTVLVSPVHDLHPTAVDDEGTMVGLQGGGSIHRPGWFWNEPMGGGPRPMIGLGAPTLPTTVHAGLAAGTSSPDGVARGVLVDLSSGLVADLPVDDVVAVEALSASLVAGRSGADGGTVWAIELRPFQLPEPTTTSTTPTTPSTPTTLPPRPASTMPRFTG